MVPHSPRVTLGMPVYNGARYLTSALDSLLAQTFADFELVISDNASNDATPAICRKFAAADPRVRISGTTAIKVRFGISITSFEFHTAHTSSGPPVTTCANRPSWRNA